MKEKKIKFISILLLKMFYGHAMFISVNSRKESRYLSSPVYSGLSLQFEKHYSDSVSSNSSVKNPPANAIKISVAILNLLSFSLFDRPRLSDKPEKKINISLINIA